MAKNDKNTSNNNNAPAVVASPLVPIKKQGRAAAIIPLAAFPALMNDFILELPQSRRQRTPEEVAKLITAGGQKATESFVQFMERCAYEDSAPIKKSIKELKQDGTVSTVPVSLGMLTASANNFFRNFILERAVNKGDLGYLREETPAAATAPEVK